MTISLDIIALISNFATLIFNAFELLCKFKTKTASHVPKFLFGGSKSQLVRSNAQIHTITFDLTNRPTKESIELKNNR